MIDSLKGKLIAVLGFGHEGKAVVKYLTKHGIAPTVVDERQLNDFTEEDQSMLKGGEVVPVCGPGAFKKLTQFDVIIRSPGIHRLHPDIRAAEQKGVEVTSQTKLFFKSCPAKIIGVTGTKGKGTTCALTYEILKRCQGAPLTLGKVYLTGNIGKTAPLDILDELKKEDIVVFELSSFQLQDLRQSPHIGVVLMVTEEHLNHSGNVLQGFHKSLEEYHSAKEAIVKFQGPGDFAISNIDYPASERIGTLGSGKKLHISKLKEDVYGASITGDDIVIHLESKHVIRCSNRKLRGKHNLENIAAASLASVLMGADSAAIEAVVKEFPGLEHRLEQVAVKNGTTFINDSIATTPESSIAAVTSFTEPLIVILGGSNKGLKYNELAKVVATASNVKHVIAIGEIGTDIADLLSSAGYHKGLSTGAKNMEEIFAQISKVAAAGDVVLLSPGTASFDMFKNYPDRGNQFREMANKYPEIR